MYERPEAGEVQWQGVEEKLGPPTSFFRLGSFQQHNIFPRHSLHHNSFTNFLFLPTLL